MSPITWTRPLCRSLIPWSIVVPAVCVAAACLAQPAPGPDYTADCTTSGCHGGLLQKKRLHQPIAAKECDGCHEAADGSEHKFTFVVEASELCLECHDEYEGKIIHAPVGEGSCTECHDPHGSDVAGLLTAPMGEVCAECHEDVTEDVDVLHAPVAAGACTACHQPHASDLAGLLVASGADVCLKCHDEVEDLMAEKASVHTAVKQGCTGCHLPHGGADRMSLRGRSNELCLGCHEDLAEQLEEAAFKHAPASAPGGCTGCHHPHASDHAGVLIQAGGKLCMSCHGSAAKGTKSAADSRLNLTDKPHQHAPVKQGDCTSCHTPHAGDRAKLLSQAYPAGIYAPFKEEQYELCFNCHDAEGFLEPQTDDLTEFRNGDRNLHHVHVHRQRKGRTCRVCHEPHAGKNTKLVPESVPFGEWRIPLGFQASPTGGSCLPGCHRAYSYDRETPVALGGPG